MSFSIKKSLVDPLTSMKIEVPSAKNIMLLQGADTYDEFNETVEQQNDATVGSVWKLVIPAITGLVCLGVTTFEYFAMRVKNEQCHDTAERLINEAAAYNEMDMKGSK